MQYTEIFFNCKKWKFLLNDFVISNSFAGNIDCGYMLEQRGGSNEYPQSMLCIKNKKNMYTHVLLYKSVV